MKNRIRTFRESATTGILFGGLLALGLQGSALAASTPLKSVIDEWNINAFKVSPGAGFPNMAYLHAAMYNAIIYIDGSYTPYAPNGLAPITAPKAGASQEAAAITAAYHTLRQTLFTAASSCAAPSSAPFPATSTEANNLTLRYCNSMHNTSSQPLPHAARYNAIQCGDPTDDPGVEIGKQAAWNLVGNNECGDVTPIGLRANDGFYPTTSRAANIYFLPFTNATSFPVTSYNNSTSVPPAYIQIITLDGMLDGTVNPGVGTWLPTVSPPNASGLPNGTAQAANQFLYHVKPFVLASTSQFRSPPPVALTSKQYTKDYKELIAIGGCNDPLTCPGVTPSSATLAQQQLGLFWMESAAPQFNRVFRELLAPAVPADSISGFAGLPAGPGANLSLPEQARLFAELTLGTSDAIIAAFDSKYAYNLWRPETAIRNASQDGNAGTLENINWLPLAASTNVTLGGATKGTPYFPTYPSGHNTLGGAVARVIANFFQNNNLILRESSTIPGSANAGSCGPLGLTDPVSGLPLNCRVVKKIKGFKQEITDTRVFSGVHFRSDDVQGIILGRKVVKYMINQTPYFKPVKGNDCEKNHDATEDNDEVNTNDEDWSQ